MARVNNGAIAKALITPQDRLALALCFAIVVHAIMILGVNFTPSEKPKPRFEPIEVVLVESPSEKEPPQGAVDLAQARSLREGNLNEPVNPIASSAAIAPIPKSGSQILASPLTPENPVAAREAILPPQGLTEPPPRNRLAKAGISTPRPSPLKASGAEADASKHSGLKSRQIPTPEPSPNAVNSTAGSRPQLPSATALINSSFALASLSAEAEMDQPLQTGTKRLRRKYTSANTREYKLAAYIEAWRAKVERVGNLNYPEEARQNQLSGSLVLDVALKPDGSVSEITICRPSGFKVLDEAAIRIVELAAPFAPFPEYLKKEVDILHITRTWRFLSSYRFSSN